jgi:hypothetical protein
LSRQELPPVQDPFVFAAVHLRALAVRSGPEPRLHRECTRHAEAGRTSMFRYGRVAGAIEGTVAACRIPMTLIEPARWKHHLKLNSSKEDCRARAIQLPPSCSG